MNYKTYYVEHLKEIGWVSLHFDYDPDVIERIKSIPKHLREWNSRTKTWSMGVHAWNRARYTIFPSHQYSQRFNQ